MNPSGDLLWLSRRSCVINESGEICRLTRAESAVGIGRQGADETRPLDVTGNTGNPRHMYEVFTTTGYSIVDSSSTVMTTSGPRRPSQMMRSLVLGEPVDIEPYAGRARPGEWMATASQPAPHLEHLPKSIIGAVLSRPSRKPTEELVISRPAFCHVWWLVEHLRRQWGAAVATAVDNRTFPWRLTLSRGEGEFRRVIAMTAFKDHSAFSISTQSDGWYLVCDGLIIG